MSDKYLQERLGLRRFLESRGVACHKKLWRCRAHDDKTPSAVLYENPDGGVLFCPVCNKSWDVFGLVELYDNVTAFGEKLKIVRHALNIPHEEKKTRKKKSPIALPLDEARKIYTTEKIEQIAADKSYGKIAGRWPYHDANGDIIALDVRFEKEGEKKDIITFWYDGNSIRWADPPVLIYNLQEALKSEKPILIHEGAKCADTARVLDRFTHLSWSGGAGKSALVDWSPISDRETFLYPDDDEPGIKAVRNILATIPRAKAIRPLVAARTIKPKGADIVEALQVLSPDELTTYILDPANHLNDSASPSGDPDAQMASPNGPDSARNQRAPGGLYQPFKILGIGDDGRASFITAWGRMIKWNLDSLSKQKLKVLVGQDYWCENYPMKGGADWDTAIDDIINTAQQKDFHESDIRGRGAWRDGDDISYHDGINTIGDYDKKKIYLRLPQHDIGITEEAAGMELTRAVKDTVFKMSFETPVDAVRCLSWTALSPFAGCLPFRPAMLMTGSSGSGKSTVATLFMRKIADGFFLNGSESTSAYIRQSVKYDTASVILDETEVDTEKKKQNRNELFSLMRSSTSDDAPDSGKGGKDGAPISYKMKNMFCFIAIDPTVEKVADENRIFRVNMILPTNGDTWKEIETDLKNLLSENNCRAIRALTWQKLHVIFSLADRIVDIIREKTGRDYRSSYADALLASSFMVVWTGTDQPTDEQIDGMLGKYYTLQPVEEHRNEAVEIIDRIMDETIEILHDNNLREKMTIMEALNRVRKGEAEEWDPDQKAKHCREHLARYGIRLVDGENVAISNRHHLIMKIIDTGNGYNKIFKRHPGFVEGQRTVHFYNGKARRCTILKDLLEKDEEKVSKTNWDDKTADEKLEALFD